MRRGVLDGCEVGDERCDVIFGDAFQDLRSICSGMIPGYVIIQEHGISRSSCAERHHTGKAQATALDRAACCVASFTTARASRMTRGNGSALGLPARRVRMR
ncbi:hypothetical protein BRD56_00170 [Thermoplasmatales archaeon SW_10_69_26]|nr:MAG: hypothetical protein BRD56_00170 [Thermoplasmatales archaeon SW_10_69_26]